MAKVKFNATERARRFVNQNASTKRLGDHAKRNLVRGITNLMAKGDKQAKKVECYSNVPLEKIFEENDGIRGLGVIMGCSVRGRSSCDKNQACWLFFDVEDRSAAEYKKCRLIKLTASEG